MAFLNALQAFLRIGSNGRHHGIGSRVTQIGDVMMRQGRDAYAKESSSACERLDQDDGSADLESDVDLLSKTGNDTWRINPYTLMLWDTGALKQDS